MKLYYDVHIHSCLSPCADDDMTPNNIINMAVLLGLNVIAVSDHNSARNLPAIFDLAKEVENLVVVPAIEVTTSEEVHVLCLFYDLEGAISFSDMLYEHLPYIKNKQDIFGNQYVMDNTDCVTFVEPKLLINATSLSIDKIISIVKEYNGVAIPAHIDKNSYSILSNLGFIPPEYCIKCVEIKNKSYNFTGEYNVINNSDAHRLEEINEPLNFVQAKEKTIKAFIDALIA